MLDRLKRIVQQSDTPAGRAFDLSVQALIVLSLVTFSIETLPNLSPATRRWLYVVEAATVLMFTAEYLLRCLLADKKLRFAFSFFGVIDLLAILPFYLAMGMDFRSIRIFRFLRLFRAFKMVRYSKAIRRFHRAFIIAKEELVLFVIITLMLLYFSAVGIYYFENEAQPEKFASVFHSLWWSVATLTTVGYGDIYPVTVGGKVFTFIVLLIGLGIVSVPAGLVASALSKARAMDDAVDELIPSYTTKAPVYAKQDARKLSDFLSRHVRHGDRDNLLYRIDSGRIRPSKNLADSLVSLLKGNTEFLMIDDQKLVYETALDLASKMDGRKRVLIVAGGPGTGKSVVAINLLVELTKRSLIAQYVTRNAAPRHVYESKLSGSMTKTRITNLFRSSGAFTESVTDEIDVLIVDEAHRLNAKSGMFQNLGENQIKEAINAARLSVFFLDENQKVTFKDIGDSEEIVRWATLANAETHHMELASQFRCNGSDGYLAWLDNALQIRATANETLDIDYDFRVCDTATELQQLIIGRNQNNKARLVAGYCWDWVSKKKKGAADIVFPEQGFSMQWNLGEDGHLWILQPDSVHQIGCIHTCQGLELDYVGVIVGPDFLIRDGKAVAVPEARSKNDSSIKGYKALKKESPLEAKKIADGIVKNTYRTLMTRGQKGCYVYCTDLETNLWFRSLIAS